MRPENKTKRETGTAGGKKNSQHKLSDLISADQMKKKFNFE